MLWHKVQGAGGAPSEPGEIEFIGGTGRVLGPANNYSVDLTALSGGIGSQPALGDFILVFVTNSSTVNKDLSVTGYTEVTDRYVLDTYGTNFGMYYKFAGSPETSLICSGVSGGTGSQNGANGATVSVWRGVDTSSPFDFTPQFLEVTNSVQPSFRSVTTISPNSKIVVAAGGAHSSHPLSWSISGLSGVLQGSTADVVAGYDVIVGQGYYSQSNPGSYQPSQWTSITNTLWSCCSAVVPLKPA